MFVSRLLSSIVNGHDVCLPDVIPNAVRTFPYDIRHPYVVRILSAPRPGTALHKVYWFTCYISVAFIFGIISTETCRNYAGRNRGLLNIPDNIPSDTTNLDLVSNHITTLKPNTFLHLNVCKNIDLSINAVSTIEEGAFNGLVILQRLQLNKNDLTKLNASIFLPLETLKSLYLGTNSINMIEVGSFSEMKSVYDIHMGENN